jgi:PAS domain S-box-containing protein
MPDEPDALLGAAPAATPKPRPLPAPTSAEAALLAGEARQTFLLRLEDQLRPLADPEAIQYAAARALGEHLGASRVGYAEILADGETSVVTHNYADGVRGIEGRYRVADYSPALIGALRAGRTVVRDDVVGSADLTDAERAAHAALEIGATVDLPLVKGGRLVALLFMHFRAAHAYTADELTLLEAVAGRTWDAVERARAEAALRVSEARLRLAVDVAELGTWTINLADGTGDLDPRAAEIVGLPPGSFGNVVQSQLTAVHPDDLAELQAAVAAGVARGGDFDLAYRVIHPDGSVHHVASRARTVADDAGRPVRLLGTNRDVTAEREAEVRLRASETRYRALFDSVDAGFCIIEVLLDDAGRPVDYRFLETNPAFVRQTGLADAVGRTMRELAPAHEAHWFEAYGRVARTGEPARFEAAAEALGRWYEVYAVRVGDPGERRVAVLFNDVAERKRAEAERDRLLRESERARAEAEGARQEAEGANRAKSEFLAVMSHELRTPLNAIGGYAELLEMGIRGPVTEQQREDLHRIQQSQRHLLGLINEVLNYAKLESGAVRYDLADVRVRDALAAAAVLVSPQASARGLALEVAPCPPELVVRADADKLRQILLNLLSNAVKFTERGGRVELRCAADGGRVLVTVRDTGIGIPADQLERIFEPFVQVRADLTRTAEGTGLGLAISRDLARGMGGNLAAESAVGVGSTFRLTLPRAPGA